MPFEKAQNTKDFVRLDAHVAASLLLLLLLLREPRTYSEANKLRDSRTLQQNKPDSEAFANLYVSPANRLTLLNKIRRTTQTSYHLSVTLIVIAFLIRG